MVALDSAMTTKFASLKQTKEIILHIDSTILRKLDEYL